MDPASDLVRRDLDVLWHPCSQMRDYREFSPLAVVGAEGCRLRLADGREILDAISSWWCKSLGHGHPRLRAALVDQAQRFDQVILANTTNEPVVRLCERLLAAANGAGPDVWGQETPDFRTSGLPNFRTHFSKVFLADNGSTAVEVALKMALQAQTQLGRPRRTRFAALANGYHGETVGALSVGDCGLYRDAYRPLLFPCAQLGPLPYRRGPEDPRWQDAGEEWPALARQLDPLAGELAAIIYEPVLQGAGGMRLYSPDLLRRLRAWADAHEVILIADEIAAGMGRCGAMLAGHLANGASPPHPRRPARSVPVLPDLAVLAKGLTAGVLPLSAVLVTERIYRAFDADWVDRRAFLHSNTFAGNALAAAVANAVFTTFATEDVLGQVARRGPRLRQGLTELAARRPYLQAVRGLGMMAAVDLGTPAGGGLDWRRRTGYRVFREAVARGALLRPLGDTLYLFPPLTTSEADIDRMLAILADSCAAVMG
jgi:adenosylmethionine-8-amino-7-oxononanoate aminotransferase